MSTADANLPAADLTTPAPVPAAAPANALEHPVAREAGVGGIVPIAWYADCHYLDGRSAGRSYYADAGHLNLRNPLYPESAIHRLAEEVHRMRRERDLGAEARATLAQELAGAQEASSQAARHVAAVDANAEVIGRAVPSLLTLLQSDHPNNYCEMTATARDGTPVVITYQRSDRPTPHDLRLQAETGRDAALGRVESLTARLAAKETALEQARRERDGFRDGYIGVVADACVVTEHAQACDVVSTPAYELAAGRILARTSASPIPALHARIGELEQRLAEREATGSEDLARLEEAVALGSRQADEFDAIIAQRDQRIATLEAQAQTPDPDIAAHVQHALAAFLAPTAAGKSAYPDALEALTNALGRRFTPDQLAILHRGMRPYATAGLNAHFVEPS